ncbi:MAG: response regulator transcription factor [Bacteroidales bacterium]|nr:response regulator transcription factor [Bacteroidales bacterium]
MVRALIIDDEKASRETLKSYLLKYCPSVQVVGEGDSVKSGLQEIKVHKPDLLFLDVEMPFGNAFDLLDQVEEQNFETIFVTAFDHYALKAINFSASYYLLKPIDIDELVRAVERVSETIESEEHNLRTRILIENIRIENKQLQKIILPLLDGFEVVRVNEILYCRAEDNFTEFHFLDGSKKLICRTLKFYEELLFDFDFFRIHKSHLINLQYLKRYKKGKGGQVYLERDVCLDVSATRKKELMGRLKTE